MSGSFSQQLGDWIDVANVPEIAAQLRVDGVCQDSRLCTHGDAYLALQGATTHGYRFAEAAVSNGAVVVLVSPEVAAENTTITAAIHALNIPLVHVPNLDNKASSLAAKFYGYPSQDLNIIAITGTDGKTSVCQFVQDALTKIGVSCGYIGTRR